MKNNLSNIVDILNKVEFPKLVTSSPFIRQYS